MDKYISGKWLKLKVKRIKFEQCIENQYKVHFEEAKKKSIDNQQNQRCHEETPREVINISLTQKFAKCVCVRAPQSAFRSLQDIRH